MLRLKIAAMCAVVFFGCGVFFGALQQTVSLREARAGAKNRLESAMIAAANMAASDKSFAAPEKLALARERAHLKTLEIKFLKKGEYEKKLFSAVSENIGKFEYVGEFATLNDSEIVLAKASLKSEHIEKIRKNFWKILALWGAVGATFGVFTGLFSSSVILRGMLDLKARLLGEKTRERKIRISEFSDLAELAELLREMEETRRSRESLKAREMLSESALKLAAIEEIAPRLEIEEFGMRLSAAFARGRSDGAFVRRIGAGKILYGRLDGWAGELKKLSESLLAAELSLKYLEDFSAEQAFEKISKIFSFSHWCVLDFSGDKILKTGFENKSWREELFSKDLPQLFTTSKLGDALMFYSRTNLCAGSENRLDAIMGLSPESEGGLFLNIEKI